MLVNCNTRKMSAVAAGQRPLASSLDEPMDRNSTDDIAAQNAEEEGITQLREHDVLLGRGGGGYMSRLDKKRKPTIL